MFNDKNKSFSPKNQRLGSHDRHTSECITTRISIFFACGNGEGTIYYIV